MKKPRPETTKVTVIVEKKTVTRLDELAVAWKTGSRGRAIDVLVEEQGS